MRHCVCNGSKDDSGRLCGLLGVVGWSEVM